MFEIYSHTEKKKYKYSDYAALDDDKRYELIDGELIMSPAPSSLHQWSHSGLDYLIMDYVNKRNLGKVFSASPDIIFDDDNTVQPDIVFISNENFPKIKKKGIFGAPDLVVEIISPGSLRRDRYIKKELYEKYGVKEYWLVDFEMKSIEVFKNTGSHFELFSLAVEKGKIESCLLPEIEIMIEDIFPDFEF